MYSRLSATDSSNSKKISYITELKCSGCGEKYSFNEIHTFCTDCQSTLLACYDLEAIRNHVDRDEIRRRRGKMWRWHELLPVKDSQNFVYLG